MTTAPDNTGEIQDGKFKPGQSGNPSGRPRGSRNKATQIVEKLFEEGVTDIANKVLELARSGDLQACRLVIERILPARKDAPVTLALPPTGTAEQINKAMAVVLEAVSAGELTPQEGQTLATLLEQQRRCIETGILEKRLDALQVILKDRR